MSQTQPPPQPPTAHATLPSGEMAAYIPISGSFAIYGSRFFSPALGFTLGMSALVA